MTVDIKASIKVLVVDDDNELRQNICESIADHYDVSSASNGAIAIESVGTGHFDVVLLDLLMPDMNGLEALARIREISPRSKVVMITAFATIDNAVEAIKRGASDYIAKPFKIEMLLLTIRRVLEEAKFDEDIRRLDLDFILSSLSNPIRRNILMLLDTNRKMKLMELCRDLDIDDHTKVVFHLRTLRENSIIQQNPDKSHSLTKKGQQSVECLKMFHRHVQNRKDK